jgi:hypothetical protein
VADSSAEKQLNWTDVPIELRESFGGRLSGLWGASSDEEAFASLSVDKQQALLLISARLRVLGLWELIRKVTNVYGEGGVGIEFIPWPLMKVTLSRRRDFTHRFAKHRDTTGGFYETGRASAILHFLYVVGEPWKWYVHFDLYSPIHSPFSALSHFRHEFFGKVRPDWRTIQRLLKI